MKHLRLIEFDSYRRVAYRLVTHADPHEQLNSSEGQALSANMSETLTPLEFSE